VGETPNGRWVFEQGKVVNGIKDGKWVGKLADSTRYYEEEYDLGQFKNGISWINGAKTEYTKPQIQPEFKGGIKEFYKFLAMNIRYPIDAARRGVSGRVMLSFVVCEDGSMCEYKVENRVGYGLDEEALRVVKLMNGKWDPGSMRGQKVKVKYNVPINFQMEGAVFRR
jgi:TonB family protein